jgi:cellulose synthase/poly-beta-1,6-N-acetylglucosamine synthase-like glycosyltransferase
MTMTSITSTATRKIRQLVSSYQDTVRTPIQSVQSTIVAPSPTIVDLREQIERYRAWIAANIRESQAPSHRMRAEKYVEDALQPVVVGGHEIRSFAPFRAELSALQTLTTGQAAFLGISLLVLLLGMLSLGVQLLVALVAIITVYYLGNVALTFIVSAWTLEHSAEEQISDAIVHALTDVEWPSYTILCPLYREAEVVSQFVEAMQALDYPTDRLQILLLTEEDDDATREAIRAKNLPAHFETVIVPDGKPRTKPRACNYGLLKATGDYVVIYDAEDIPDPLQLKKAILTFANHGPDLGCVQAKLNFYNKDQNILTRWFTAEYSAWFEMTLPGLQWADLSLPLGGTSNHFRTKTLHTLGMWDVFNVTEDCDLGLRLSRFGFKTVVLDSITLEEANPRVKNWIRQRSRWIKGYMQTYLVHMRHPRSFLPPSRWRDFISLQLVVGGRTLVLMVNPVLWTLLFIYLLFRPVVEHTYHTLFPAPVLYMGTTCLIFGNLLYVYTTFTGCLKREQHDLIKWALLMPIYWAMSSWAAFIALRQLITKPHYWEKTSHGLHMSNGPVLGKPIPEGLEVREDMRKPVESPAPSPTTVQKTIPEITSPSRSISTDTLPGYPTTQMKAAAKQHRNSLGALVRVTRSQLSNNRWLILTFVTACVLSVASLVYFFQNHGLLLYADANAHLSIARRIIDNLTPGLAQLGGVWLPLPHLAMLPFAQNYYLWNTGLAGSFVSMPCYIIAAIYLFLSAQRLTKNGLASFVGALVFMLNPNILYLQTTPLSELVSVVTMTAACYYCLAWAQEGRPIHLILWAASAFLATMARYDGWFLFMAFFGVVAVIGWLKFGSLARVESALIVFALLGGLGIAMWFVWCGAIFGDPLYFQRGEFSSQAQMQGYLSGGQLYTYHNLAQSIRYFAVLTIETVGPGLFALSILGIAVFLLRRRFAPDTLAALTFLGPCLSYVVSFYTGQVIVFVPGAVPPDAPHQLFNARFGSVAVPAIALFVSVLANYRFQLKWTWFRRPIGVLRWQAWASLMCVIVIVGQTLLTISGGIISLQDGLYGVSCAPAHPIIMYLAQHYTGGKVLKTVASSKIDGLEPLAGITFSNVVYEGSGNFWKNALNRITPDVSWIVMNPNDPSDILARYVDVKNSSFQSQFTRVVEEKGGLSLYGRNQRVWVPVRPLSPALIADSNARSQCRG